MAPGIFGNFSKKWTKPTKYLGPNGFLLDRLITPPLEDIGSDLAKRTKTAGSTLLLAVLVL